MRTTFAHWVWRGALAALVTLAGASRAEALQDPRGGTPPIPTRVTEQDVNASNQKIESAYAAIIQMWTDEFGHRGARFVAPSLLRYRGAVRTSCGVLPSDNALYCPSRNAVFFDELFVARQTKDAASELGTDGDMVAIGIIAHEVGHAVAAQLGEISRIPYENEATADCLTGAFARHAQKDGSLEKGDLEEALYGMMAAADPNPQLTGDQRRDARILLASRLLGHGSGAQRTRSFQRGFEGGGGACVERLQ
jgi:predicted metalloprotease